ncbi:DUF3237 domain-containing protein [Loktanella sp. TSTF-M6]|uniref:UPF0311 protein LGQ03_07410 n=1 Tax=Loktanella gaetbuli TaxID=2881335 RepID=A0ABS8BU13_9RHOB|nr:MULTISPECIES: DUF3237 domain-containing protein [Loktanella]MCB5199064.1 DUF3237 domain-containing protein [Loktanella gaetbuli]
MTRPPVPALTFAFTIEAEIAKPQSAGSSPHGERLHIPINGGRVHGPRLTGTILPGGSDWPVIGPDGNSRIEAHYTIRADNGALIYVVNKGLRVSSTDTLRRLRAGEPVDASEVYMRAAPVFDAPDGVHAWLRDRIFVCSLAPSSGSVTIDVYSVD